MRLKTPRIAPVPEDQWTDEQKEIAAPMMARRGKVFNIFRTQLAHPDAMRGFLGIGNYVLSRRNSLPAREREIVILRIGYLCRSGYEWAQHAAIGRVAGLTDDEIRRLTVGSAADDWSDADRALLRAAEELVGDHFVSDATWAALRGTWSEQQLMDLVFAVGQYTLVSMALNSFGVQLEDTTERFPAEQFADGLFPRGS